MKGQCFCGKITYQIEGALKFNVHDHCSMCRKASGAPFVTWGGVKETQFKLLQGGNCLTSFKSSNEAERQFCSCCGSQLFFRSSRWPGELHFTVATIVDKLETPPKAHVFFSDKVSWVEICDDLPKYGGASGMEPLSKGS